MKKIALLAITAMIFVLAACSKPGAKLLDDVSGVWRAQDGGLVTINNSKDGLILIIGEKDVAVKLGEVDEDQGTVNLNVTLNDGKPGIWTIKQIWDSEKKKFTLGFTLHDGTQDELSFVRKVSADDAAIIERNRKALTAVTAPSITTAATDVSEIQAATQPIPATNETHDQQFKAATYCGWIDDAKFGATLTDKFGVHSLSTDSGDKEEEIGRAMKEWPSCGCITGSLNEDGDFSTITSFKLKDSSICNADKSLEKR